MTDRQDTSESVHADSLQRYVDVLLTFGVNLQKDQPLLVTAPVEASYVVRLLTERAYQQGSGLVTALYDDPQNLRDRLAFGREQAISATSPWLHEGIERAIESGMAILELSGPYPTLLTDIPVDKIGVAHAAQSNSLRRQNEMLTRGLTNSCKAPVVTNDWAAQTFPGARQAQARLWALLFAQTRTDSDTAATTWPHHIEALEAKRLSYENTALATLTLTGPGTDLKIRVAPGSRWLGGQVTSTSGIRYFPTLPAEELFCALDPSVAEGTLSVEQPLALLGARVSNLQLTFQNGCIVNATADQDLGAFEQLLTLDEGLLSPGELGVVSRPLSNRPTAMPMVDRNQFCHIGLGAPDPRCFEENADSAKNDATMHLDLSVSLTRVGTDQTALMDTTQS